MLRLAWFTPLPPARTGIARYSRELIPSLSSFHAIEIFVDADAGAKADLKVGTTAGKADLKVSSTNAKADLEVSSTIPVFSAHDFVWKNRREPYDLTVYQMGNAPYHDYMWPYLVRYPGLVVLHDGQLHHSRARALLQQKRYGDYRREFRFNHPDAHFDVPELGIEGLLGSLTYFWPMLRTTADCSRRIVVHNAWLADRIREQHPDARVDVIEMGVPEPRPNAHAREEIRARHGIPHDAVLFVAPGKVTPEKRIFEAVRALSTTVQQVPAVHLLLAGELVDDYDPRSIARTLGIPGKVSIAGYVGDDEFDDYIAAADICLCLRWPTSRETSASWLRCLAAGRPAITSDLAHTVDIPTLDLRDGSVLGSGDPVGASVDIVDEKHSLNVTLRKLAEDKALRDRLGRNALALWNRRFQLQQMVEAYRRAIEMAVNTTLPDEQRRSLLPSHLLADGCEYPGRVLFEAGFPPRFVGETLDIQR
jgi:glycosyltransferase involved in cell wall biosynthesis